MAPMEVARILGVRLSNAGRRIQLPVAHPAMMVCTSIQVPTDSKHAQGSFG
jgi:ABC-type Fe3+ transport system permease subunit